MANIIPKIIGGVDPNQLKSELNATGDAPIYAIRAKGLIDMTTAANVTGLTYVRTGTTVVVSGITSAANIRVGHLVYVDFAAGATDGSFVVTAVTDTTFTFEHGTSGNVSGSCSLPRFAVNGANIAFASDLGTGLGYVGFLVDMDDDEYAIGQCGQSNTAGRMFNMSVTSGGVMDKHGFQFTTYDTSAGGSSVVDGKVRFMVS